MQCTLPTPFIYFFLFFGVLSGFIPDCQLPKFTENTHKNCTKLRIKWSKIVCGGGVAESEGGRREIVGEERHVCWGDRRPWLCSELV